MCPLYHAILLGGRRGRSGRDPCRLVEWGGDLLCLVFQMARCKLVTAIPMISLI